MQGGGHLVIICHLRADFVVVVVTFLKAIESAGKAFGTTEMEINLLFTSITPPPYSTDKGQCFLSHSRNVGGTKFHPHHRCCFLLFMESWYQKKLCAERLGQSRFIFPARTKL